MINHPGKRFTMKRNYWQIYWSCKTNGGHRLITEEFLEKEASEKLYLLAGGNNILDVGCGAAELLTYYAVQYENCIGADQSETMLYYARKRIENLRLNHRIKLIHQPDFRVWEELKLNFRDDCPFDRITAGQLIQYLDKEQIDSFIANSVKFLAPNGKIWLFDIVDSRTYELWKSGLYKMNDLNISILLKIIIRRMRDSARILTGKPVSDMGYGYAPMFFIAIAQKYGLQVSFINSMYYEYRYHAVFSQSNVS